MMKVERMKDARREESLQGIAGDIARDIYATNAPAYEQWAPIYKSLRRAMWNWTPNTSRTKNPRRYRPLWKWP
jgi:hypothetical protein